jgi:hypothetical protein
MAKQKLRVGSVVNDGTGDTLRSGAVKINENFDELYAAVGLEGTAQLVTAIHPGNGISINQTTGAVTITNTKPAQNTFKNIAISGQPAVVASSTTDTLTLVAGTNIALATNASSRAVTINNSYTLPTATTSQLGGVRIDGTTITINNGVISAAGSTNKLVNGLNEFTLDASGNIIAPSKVVTGPNGNTIDAPALTLGTLGNYSLITQPENTDIITGNNTIRIQGQRGYGTWSNTQADAGWGGNIEMYGGQGGETGGNPNVVSGGEGGYIDIRSGDGQAGRSGGFLFLKAGDAKFSSGFPSNVSGGHINITAGNANDTIETNKGTGGDVTISAGAGNKAGQHGNVVISTNNGSWFFTQDGSLGINGGYALSAAQNTNINAGAAPTVAYTSLDGVIGGIKATIKVVSTSAWINGDFQDTDTQMCEMLISTKRRYVDNGGTWIKTAVASVYGVTHTSDAPLATFTVNFVENYVSSPGATPRDVVQILAEPTAAVTGPNMWVQIVAIELTND